MSHHILVYGTLMSGGRNHHLLEGATFVGYKRTQNPDFLMEQFESVTSPGKFTPGVRRADHNGAHIAGELYAVDDAMLAAMDELEGVGVKYDRDSVPLVDGTRAWIYLRRGEGQKTPSPHVNYIAGSNTYRWEESPRP